MSRTLIGRRCERWLNSGNARSADQTFARAAMRRRCGTGNTCCQSITAVPKSCWTRDSPRTTYTPRLNPKTSASPRKRIPRPTPARRATNSSASSAANAATHQGHNDVEVESASATTSTATTTALLSGAAASPATTTSATSAAARTILALAVRERLLDMDPVYRKAMLARVDELGAATEIRCRQYMTVATAVRGQDVNVRPLLILDVDGVLYPTGRAVPPGYERVTSDAYDVVVSRRHGDWLQMLASLFEPAWGTTWGHAANDIFGSVLGLPVWPVIPLADLPRAGTRKLAAVSAYVGDRPAAWVDDELYDDARSWAESRHVPTLLIATRASVGLTQGDVDRLRAFGEELQSG